jgi:hypothetical protein
MASIASLQYDRGQYQELIIQLNSVCNHLDSAADETSQIKPTMDRNYTLNDDSSSVCTVSTNITKEIRDEKEFLKDTVIPAIEDKISQIDSQIAALEEEERMRESGITRWNSSGWWY